MTHNDATPGSKTPPRHNYANTNTPIASIKRPRSSLERPGKTGTTPAVRPMLTSPPPKKASEDELYNGEQTPAQRRSANDETNALSPMHPPKSVHRDEKVEDDESSWVGRKVDALFSPVLSFLNSAQEANDLGPATDEDVTMMDSSSPNKEDDDTQPTASTVSSTMTSSPRGDNSLGVKESISLDDDDDEHSACDSLAAVEHDHSGEDDEFNPWQFIKSLPEYKYVRHLCPPVTLPAKDPDSPPISLVLDLDETLVHCTVEPVDRSDLTFPVQFHGVTYTVNVRLRPHLYTFLEKIRGKFEVIVFTASQKVYANELLNRIDPEGKFIQHRLFRESCLAVEGNFLKDLNVLGRDLSKTILVDNSPHAFGYQVDNGIPIESWFDDDNDRELLKLERFLRQNCDAKDVREKIRDKFRCYQLVDTAPLFEHS